jgi:hypothetical protein
MNNNDIVFILDDKEKIVIKLKDSIDTIPYFYTVPISFFQEKKQLFSVKEDIDTAIHVFHNLLQKALNKKLNLHTSITKDIGFLSNEELQNKPHFVYTELGGRDCWVGNLSLLWADNIYRVWLYNNNDGDIIFEATPVYPHSSPNAKNKPDFIPYEEWIKDYKPFLIRTIPETVAQSWYEQSKILSKEVKKNVKRIMKNNEIVFALSDTEKIVLELEEPITKVHCCYDAPIAFFQGKKRTFLVHANVSYNIDYFYILLENALNKKLKLHKSITEDIGFLYNETTHQKNDSADNKIHKIEHWNENDYSLWSPCVKYGNLQTWIYNNEAGDIIFEITPVYPYHYCDPEEEPNFIPYEEWMKDYKPFLIRTIPKDVAQQWLEQTKVLLKQITKNIKKREKEMDQE